ncbi:Protein CBG20457 [Caenorhabditis briggsae]|uniref:Protein CBG20457 n=1 Tax=Caenorhabditis briggsae TaxID=6238 RepID=A8XXT0_CAEBR|nr:Protein CBG20457 [Caenorhabditis briggsae]CAP37449.2 Protein CBG20457 [Caenorhabditis briggsae]
MTDPPAKNFSIRLEFRNLQSMIYAKKYYGVTENHFGLDCFCCLSLHIFDQQFLIMIRKSLKFYYQILKLKISLNFKTFFMAVYRFPVQFYRFIDSSSFQKIISEISDQNVNPVLEIAKKYSFEFVLKKCENFLIKNSNFSTVEKMKKLAREFDLEELQSAYCPICRKYVNFSTAVPNFTLKNVLDSLEELGKNEKRPFENTKNITIERLQEQNSQLEREKETAKDDLRFAETFINDYWSQIQHLKAQSAQRNSTARKYKFLFFGLCGLLVISIYQYYQKLFLFYYFPIYLISF